jgi:hypothetical protein
MALHTGCTRLRFGFHRRTAREHRFPPNEIVKTAPAARSTPTNGAIMSAASISGDVARASCFTPLQPDRERAPLVVRRHKLDCSEGRAVAAQLASSCQRLAPSEAVRRLSCASRRVCRIGSILTVHSSFQTRAVQPRMSSQRQSTSIDASSGNAMICGCVPYLLSSSAR